MRTKLIAAGIFLGFALEGAGDARSTASRGGFSASHSVLESRVYDVLPVAQRAGAEISLDGQWDLAQAQGELSFGAADAAGLEWRPVTMPATIQYALYRAGAIADPWYGDNWKSLQWIQDRDWYLRRHFQIPADWRGRHIRLRFDGMDYTGAVWLDGKFLGVHEGMFGGPTFDISQTAEPEKEHELLVRLIHETAPAEPDGGDVSPSNVMKSAALDGRSYIWNTRFRTIGLWRSIRLVSSGQAYMEVPWARTDRLSADSAGLWLQSMIVNAGEQFDGVVEARIVDLSSGKAVWQQSAAQRVPSGTSYWERAIDVRHPKLWWPNGMGSQPLYRLELSLVRGGQKEDSIASRFGIRTVELRRNPYPPNQPRANPGLPSWLTDPAQFAAAHRSKRWKRPDVWPGENLLEDDALYNSDESARYMFVVNGRPIYAKGVSWLTSDDLLSLTPQRESWLIKAAQLARINLIRLNGGNDLFETEQFYNLCDEAGILVWQEFPFTWTQESEIPLTTWREQIKQSVLRLRQHPSLAVYVSGNEFNPFVEKLAPYLGIGREVVAEYDDRPFRMASPGEGDYHAYFAANGNFEDIWIGDPNWYLRNLGDNDNFIGEWSLAVYMNMSALKRVVPEEELTRGPVGYDVKHFIATHPILVDHFAEEKRAMPLVHRKLSWYGDVGKADVAQYVEYSEMAQADVYGYVFEQWRAQFPFKNGETVWTYNLHTPSCGWQLIDWFGQPQISYYSTKRADEPVHVMADTNFFSWGPGSTFHALVFAVNDGTKPLPGARVTARILDREMKPVLTRQWILAVPANGIKSASREIRWQIPAETPESYFFLELTMSAADGRRISRRAYWLRVLQSLADLAALAKWQSAAVAEPLATNGPWLKPQIEKTPTALSARVLSSKVFGPEWRLTVLVKNTGVHPAYPVQLMVQPDTYSVLWSDDYFWLAPGESVKIDGIVRLDMTGLDPITHPPVASVSGLQLSVAAWNSPVLRIGETR